MRFGRKLPDAHERHRVGVLHDIAVDQHFQLVEVSELMRTEKIHDTSLFEVQVSLFNRSPLPFESGNPAKFGTAFLWIRYNGNGFSLGQRKMEEGGRLFSLQKVQRAGQLDEMMDRYAGILRFLPASSCILREVVVILFGSIILL